MHAECQFEVMTYISISKPAGHAGKASKIWTCVHMDYVFWSGNALQDIVVWSFLYKSAPWKVDPDLLKETISIWE